MTNEDILSKFNSRKYTHLGLSLIIDVIGMSSFVLPGLGELGDLVIAPLTGISIFIMYKRRRISALVGGALGFTEEILPMTDFVPSATLMWIYTYIINRKSTLKAFAKETKEDLETLDNL